MSIKKFIKHGFQKPLSNTVNYLLKAFNIFVIYRIGNAIGDQLCMSAIVRLIDEQYPYKIVVISSYPKIFENNPRVWRNIGVKRYSLYISRILRFLSGSQLENFLFKNNEFPLEEYMRLSGRKLHLVEAHSLHFNNEITYTKIKNEIYLSKSEIKKYAKKFNLPESYSVIQPNSKRSYTPNKQWSMENFQQVVDKRNDIHWVQVGGQNEFLLDSVEDYRDETTLRELFYIVSRSQFVFANEGLINHIASAFKVTSYVISSGFSCSSLAKYDNSVFFDASGSCENSPCWLLDECGVSGKPCLSNIDPETVVSRLP